MKISNSMVWPFTAREEGDGIFSIGFDGLDPVAVKATEKEIQKKVLEAFILIAEERLQHRILMPVPAVKNAEHILTIPFVMAMKIMLWNELIKRGISKAELARRVGVRAQVMIQLFNLRTNIMSSGLDTLVNGFKAIGMTVEFTAD